MPSAFEILNVSVCDDDTTIRKRYLDLVRKYPPEQNPERFSAVREAYDKIQTLAHRVQYVMEQEGFDLTLDEILTELNDRVKHNNSRFPDFLRLYEQQDDARS